MRHHWSRISRLIRLSTLAALLVMAYKVPYSHLDAFSRASNSPQFSRIFLGEPIIVAVSPPGEKRWGFYQFPDMWRAPGGEIYLAINVGEDADVGEHQPTTFFISKDEGQSWQPIDANQVDFSPEIFNLPNGKQVAFGTEKYVYHYSTYGPRKRGKYLLGDAGIKPLRTFLDAYEAQVFALYRYADIPEKIRRIPMKSRSGPEASWQQEFATLDSSDLVLRTLIRAKDASGTWHDIPAKVTTTPQDASSVFWPDRVIRLPDGTLLWPLSTNDPHAERGFYRVHCLASTDSGHTWKIRGIIADQRELATWGYGCGEQSLQRMPDGTLLCVMRTRMSGNPEDSNYLAAARSKDNGHTWTRPVSVASFSVTPHLRTLKNGSVIVIYGRPGVHVRASADSGQRWSEAVPLVGPSEAELLAMPFHERWKLTDVISCSNTDVVVTGPDRFIVAYSDFQHLGPDGKQCKAIKVRQVVVTPSSNRVSKEGL